MTGQNRKAGTRNRNTREIPVHDAHIMEIRANRWIEDISFVNQFSSSWRSFIGGYNGVRWIELLIFVVDRTNINITEICTGSDLTTVLDDAPKSHPFPRIRDVERYLIRQRPHFIADFLIRSIIGTFEIPTPPWHDIKSAECIRTAKISLSKDREIFGTPDWIRTSGL